MRKVLHILNVVFSWAALFAAVALFFYCLGEVRAAKVTGQEAYVLGYRPIMILTGSMEPTIRTKGVAISKEVVDISELNVGDIVSFHVTQEDNKIVRVTHRIVKIDSEGIQTKGDNNSVVDPYILTIDNIESKVVFIMNWTATLIDIWATSSGKIWICSIVLGTILLYFSVKLLIKSFILKISGGDQESDVESFESNDLDDSADFSFDSDYGFDPDNSNQVMNSVRYTQNNCKHESQQLDSQMDLQSASTPSRRIQQSASTTLEMSQRSGATPQINSNPTVTQFQVTGDFTDWSF